MNAAARLVFVDAGVLIAAARGISEAAEAALVVLGDPSLRFASSLFVRLEVLPKPLYHHSVQEAAFYQTFFAAVDVWTPVTDALLDAAFAEAVTSGLSALDALHIVSAAAIGAEEFVTSEGGDKPVHRTNLVRVTTIRT